MTTSATTPTGRTYDAIVVGGGHNGLVNGAYLAKAGLKTLILERRPVVGGAAITEELRPGFWFTTFSYALSLLRPRIVQDLELVKHGFMPLLMTSTFAPAEDGGYLWLTKDHDQNVREIARHSRHDADAYSQYSHDLDMVCKALKPLLDEAPPDLFSDDPEERLALARLARRFRGMDRRTLHNAVRLLTGSAADFLDDYFESELLKGYLASTSIIGTKVGPRSQGSGLVLLYHSLGEHDGEFGAWAFHKGGNGGFTQVLARAATSFGAEIRLEAPVEAVITKDGRAAGVALADGTEFFADTVVSALDPRRTFLELVDPRELPDDLVESIRRMRFQGTSSKVNFALDGLPEYPALPGRDGRLPRLHQHRPDDGLPRASLRRGQVRLVQLTAVHRRRHPEHHRPGHGAPGQARHVLLHPVHPVPPARERLGRRAGRTWATPCSARSSPSSRGSATSCCSARWSRRSTSSGRRASRRATSSPGSSSRRRCSSSGRRPDGRSTAHRSAVTTSAARAPTPAAASWAPRACSRPARSSRTAREERT